MKFWACLLELWQIRRGRKERFVRVRRWLSDELYYWRGIIKDWADDMSDTWWLLFGRFWKVERKPWQGYWWYQLEAWQTRFGRLHIGPRKSYISITWWTYWVAVRRTLKVARLCKSMWALGTLDVDTCLWSYKRYARVQQRALAKGYTRLASESIHDRWR